MPLDEIMGMCIEAGCPCLPAIVVNASGELKSLPGKGFYAAISNRRGAAVRDDVASRRLFVAPMQAVVRGWPSWDALRRVAGLPVATPAEDF